MNRHIDTFVAIQKPPVFRVYYFRKIKMYQPKYVVFLGRVLFLFKASREKKK